MIAVGGDVRCDHPQGSCNEDIGFPQLFLDGSNVANGIHVNATYGPWRNASIMTFEKDAEVGIEATCTVNTKGISAIHQCQFTKVFAGIAPWRVLQSGVFQIR